MAEYDEIKKMLKKVRNVASGPTYGSIKEQQQEYFDNNATQVDTLQDHQPISDKEGSDFAVINNVDVKIHSEDPEDLNLANEEKGKISQLIDDFRKEVSNLVNFTDLNIYENSAKLTGTISDLNIGFSLSAGDDNGVYLNVNRSNAMLKIDATSLDIINKLTKFQSKYTSVINDLLVNRKEM